MLGEPIRIRRGWLITTLRPDRYTNVTCHQCHVPLHIRVLHMIKDKVIYIRWTVGLNYFVTGILPLFSFSCCSWDSVLGWLIMSLNKLGSFNLSLISMTLRWQSCKIIVAVWRHYNTWIGWASGRLIPLLTANHMGNSYGADEGTLLTPRSEDLLNTLLGRSDLSGCDP